MPNVVQRRVALLSDDGKFADSMTPQAVLDAVEHVDQTAESIDGALAEMLAKSAGYADQAAGSATAAADSASAAASARADAVTARNGAQAAQIAAAGSASQAGAAAAAAQVAQTGAETARGQAEVARQGAETALAGVPSAVEGALDTQVEAAQAAASAAQTSATSAATSATQAVSAAQTATTMAGQTVELQDSTVATLISQRTSRAYAELSAAFVSQFDGTGKTVAQINAWLAAEDAFGGSKKHKQLVGTVEIDAPLILSSDTVLDVRASVTAAGTTHTMLTNEHYGSSTTRDKNITVIGGVWAAGDADGNKHRIDFKHVDGLVVTGQTITSASGKYAICLTDCTGFEIGNIDLNVASDGVHMIGKCRGGHVWNIRGWTGDDSVAITSVDYPSHNPADSDLGTAEDIIIENIFTTTAHGNCVKVLPGSIGGTVSTTVRNVTVRNVKGAPGNSAYAVYLGGDSASPYTMGGVLDTVTVESIESTTFRAVNITQLLDARSVLIRSPRASGTNHAIFFGGGILAGDFTVSDTVFDVPTGTYPVGFWSGANPPALTSLRFRNVRLKVATQSAGLIKAANAGFSIGAIYLDGYRCDRAAWSVGDFGYLDHCAHEWRKRSVALRMVQCTNWCDADHCQCIGTRRAVRIHSQRDWFCPIAVCRVSGRRVQAESLSW